MKCPECGHDMGKSSKCLRCGYTVRAIVPVDPEKIEQEEPTKTKVINADDVRVSRASGGGLFDSIFGGFGSIFGGGLGGLFDSIFGGSIFGDLFGEEEDTGYEYDPKYYDAFGNEIHLPDEFERDSVEISAVEFMEEEPKDEKKKKKGKNDDRDDKK